MRVILTEVCCGKTYLAERNSNFVDLDIFNTLNSKQTKPLVPVIHSFFDYFSKNCDNDKIYLMALGKFHRFNLSKIKTIKVTDIIIAKDIEFRKKTYLNRLKATEQDLSAREKFKYDEYSRNLEDYYKRLAKFYADFYNIKIHYLEEGRFLYDYFYG